MSPGWPRAAVVQIYRGCLRWLCWERKRDSWHSNSSGLNGHLAPWNKWDAKKMKAEREVQVHEARQAIHMRLFPRQAD